MQAIIALLGGLAILHGIALTWLFRLERRTAGMVMPGTALTRDEHARICEAREVRIGATLASIEAALAEQNRQAHDYRERNIQTLADMQVDVACIQTLLNGNPRTPRMATGQQQPLTGRPLRRRR
jgi:hypothetical protein